MARIRTIKPEFPHSESMGRVSRDARLTFIMLWTIADDSGRLRGNSRMLASLLFPYDDDAPSLIDEWLRELESEACVVRYLADGQSYLQVCNWLNHQKIDKPSNSKIPEFDEASRIFSKPRECSSEDQRIKDQGSKDLTTLSGKPDPIEPVSQNPEKPNLAAKAKAVLQFLNEKTGRAYEPVDSNLKPIVARMKEGATEAHLRQVIAKKCREWGADEKMEQYLRPKTLFNATNFANYKGELVVPQEPSHA